MEKEEQEKEHLRKAKEAQEMQENAIKEAKLISEHKLMRKQAHQQETLSQASSLIQMIKKGDVDAQQLSQIMMGQKDLAKLIEEEESQVVQPAPAIFMAPVTMPKVTKPEVEKISEPQPKPQNVKVQETKTNEVVQKPAAETKKADVVTKSAETKKVEVVQQKKEAAPEV